jgi:aldose 1-epimerase
MPAPLDLAAGDARLRVAPWLGGAITDFTWRAHPVLRATPPDGGDVRACACYPLVPYSNRIRDARLRFAAGTYALARNFGDHPHAIHGLGWQRAWDVLAHTDRHLRLGLVHATADPAWPWPFRAVQTFELAPGVLQATLTIESLASEPFPFGLGWHPYFPKTDGTVLRFGARSVWCNDATHLPVSRTAIPPQWRFDTPRPLANTVLDHVFNGWTGHAEIDQPASGMRATLAADRACGRLVVYAPAQHAFVALEPVTHETDAFNRAADGAVDTGLRVLGPGAAFSCTMRLTVAALAS